MSLIAAAAILLLQTAPASAQDEVVTTAAPAPVEAAASVREREAVAYAAPLPRGAPTQDYPLVAWCDALVSGHVRLGESLNTTDDLDLEIMRLGRLEAADFRSALAVARARQTPATLDAAERAAADATSKWAPLMAEENVADRSQAFGLFFGLPGRCEHAARRIRDNISTPPATLESVGLDEEGNPVTAGTGAAPVAPQS